MRASKRNMAGVQAPQKTNKRASREDNMNKKQALEILNEVINNYIDIFRSDKKEIKEIEKALKILNQQASEQKG